MVPYKIFNKEDDENAYYLTLAAIQEINEIHCVQVYPNDTSIDYINIVLGDRMSSHLGYQRNGAQNITIIKGVENIGKFSIVHELMHSLGFGHEHNRPDRDSNVEIMWDNLKEGTDEPYFSINHPGGNFSMDNLKYDTMSLMHATKYNPSIAVDEYVPVIKSKDTDEEISSHKELTDLDIERLKKTYSCDVCHGDNNGPRDIFRYPGDCTKYYQCDNGKPAVIPCGQGLHIKTNVDAPYCDWPPNAKCTEFFNLWT